MSSSIQSAKITSASPLLPISRQDTQDNPPASQGRFGNRNVIKTSAVGALVGTAVGIIADVSLIIGHNSMFEGGVLTGVSSATALVAWGALTGFALTAITITAVDCVKSYFSSGNNNGQSALGQGEYTSI